MITGKENVIISPSSNINYASLYRIDETYNYTCLKPQLYDITLPKQGRKTLSMLHLINIPYIYDDNSYKQKYYKYKLKYLQLKNQMHN